MQASYRLPRHAALMLVLCLLLALPVAAPSGGNSTSVIGTRTDASDAVVPNVVIEIRVNSLVTLSAPGNAADSKDMFHGLGDHGEMHKESAQVRIINLMNRMALYDFLSTFSDTHYVTPRTLTAQLGFSFQSELWGRGLVTAKYTT